MAKMVFVQPTIPKFLWRDEKGTLTVIRNDERGHVPEGVFEANRNKLKLIEGGDIVIPTGALFPATTQMQKGDAVMRRAPGRYRKNEASDHK